MCKSCLHNSPHFNPRPPRGGRRQLPPRDLSRQQNFNPRPPRGGRRVQEYHLNDKCTVFQSTPPARGATTDFRKVTAAYIQRFQSTPPARGATILAALASAATVNFNPRPPRGGRLRQRTQAWLFGWDFNPRPPRGGRRFNAVLSAKASAFQSTPPARGATMFGGAYDFIADISIHAPREGGDHRGLRAQSLRHYFNPRPPRGGRQEHS